MKVKVVSRTILLLNNMLANCLSSSSFFGQVFYLILLRMTGKMPIITAYDRQDAYSTEITTLTYSRKYLPSEKNDALHGSFPHPILNRIGEGFHVGSVASDPVRHLLFGFG